MLASASAPFDNHAWLFEIKWDGFRSLCRVDQAGLRLLGRRKTDFTGQFPQLAGLAQLPAGLILDGEIVAMKEGKPDFTALLGLTGMRSRDASHRLLSSRPQVRKPQGRLNIVYVAFDLLYLDYKPVMHLACEQRRELLQELIQKAHEVLGRDRGSMSLSSKLLFSAALNGSGSTCFEHAAQMGLEGIIAKKRSSPYKPGIRSRDWLKIKRRHQMVCAIIGYEPSPERGLRSLIIAGVVDGKMQCVGRVGSGIDDQLHGKLLAQLQSLRRSTPAIPSDINGLWVEPKLYCRVQYDQLLDSGNLRSPVFEGLISSISSISSSISAKPKSPA